MDRNDTVEGVMHVQPLYLELECEHVKALPSCSWYSTVCFWTMIWIRKVAKHYVWAYMSHMMAFCLLPETTKDLKAEMLSRKKKTLPGPSPEFKLSTSPYSLFLSSPVLSSHVSWSVQHCYAYSNFCPRPPNHSNTPSANTTLTTMCLFPSVCSMPLWTISWLIMSYSATWQMSVTARLPIPLCVLHRKLVLLPLFQSIAFN